MTFMSIGKIFIILEMDVDICSGCLLYPTIFILGWKISERAISSAKQSFIDAGLKGNDMGRADRPLVPESLGLISAVVFLVLAGTVTVLAHVKEIVIVVQIPFLDSNVDLVLFLGALLTITSAAFLGFVDDVLNLRWRHKLWAPGLFSVFVDILRRTVSNDRLAEGGRHRPPVFSSKSLWSTLRPNRQPRSGSIPSLKHRSGDTCDAIVPSLGLNKIHMPQCLLSLWF